MRRETIRTNCKYSYDQVSHVARMRNDRTMRMWKNTEDEKRQSLRNCMAAVSS